MKMVNAAAMTTEIADADVINICMKTAVVILNWNTEDFLRKFLPDLLLSCQKCESTEVIVADNDSSDGSLDVMQEVFPQVRTITFEKNLGFTGGYNRAFDQIDCEYFVLINSDIEVTPDWLSPLVEWMDNHPECGACAPKLHSWHERDKFEYAGAAGGYIDKFGYPFCRGRVMKRIETDRGQYDTPKDVFWATGACLMVRSSVYRHLGGLDDRFFAHMEEIDLCWRMQLDGWKVSVVPQSVVYHVGGGTLPASSPYKLYLNYRNNLLMLNNNLAYTYALEEAKKGCSFQQAVSKAVKRASAKINRRKCLDRLSSLVYLLTLKKKYYKAVVKAHRDYKSMAKGVDKEQLLNYLISKCRIAGVTGLYGRSIILQSFLKKEKIFSYIKDEDFRNI